MCFNENCLLWVLQKLTWHYICQQWTGWDKPAASAARKTQFHWGFYRKCITTVLGGVAAPHPWTQAFYTPDSFTALHNRPFRQCWDWGFVFAALAGLCCCYQCFSDFIIFSQRPRQGDHCFLIFAASRQEAGWGSGGTLAGLLARHYGGLSCGPVRRSLAPAPEGTGRGKRTLTCCMTSLPVPSTIIFCRLNPLESTWIRLNPPESTESSESTWIHLNPNVYAEALTWIQLNPTESTFFYVELTWIHFAWIHLKW